MTTTANSQSRTLDSSKIAFIVCVNDMEMFNAAMSYVSQLSVPEGMSVDVLALTDARSMCDGYERGRLMSDARYKIYMHQDVMVLKKDLLAQLVRQFERSPHVGLIGLAGCKRLPDNLVWWHGEAIYCRATVIIDGRERYYAGNTSEDCVEAVDGLLMATQYDIPWRADLFTDWHFYDISQCLEYRRAGYKVAVPGQAEASWVLHVSKSSPGGLPPRYFEQWKVFIREYAADFNSPR